MDLSERIERFEASHIRLMTDHELFMKKHEAFVAEQDREWERQQERWRQQELQREEDRKRDVAMDKRIADLVSGIGEFMRQSRR